MPTSPPMTFQTAELRAQKLVGQIHMADELVGERELYRQLVAAELKRAMEESFGVVTMANAGEPVPCQ